MNWKILAIVFIILFALETLYIGWSVSYVMKEERLTNDCFYNICADYPDAYYLEGVCTCYDYDMLGNLVPATTKYMK